jgi:hypothetical protein
VAEHPEVLVGAPSEEVPDQPINQQDEQRSTSSTAGQPIDEE